ncbi:hypothetical protein Hanom_Chr04g00323641 [Helianthus anomalus]
MFNVNILHLFKAIQGIEKNSYIRRKMTYEGSSSPQNDLRSSNAVHNQGISSPQNNKGNSFIVYLFIFFLLFIGALEKIISVFIGVLEYY